MRDGSTVPAAAAAADAEPPISGAESSGATSMTGELGALDAMELGDEPEELELGSSEGGRTRVCEWSEAAAKARRPAFIAGAPRFSQRSGAEIFATRHGSSRCEEISSLRLLNSRAGNTELAPTFKDAPPLTLSGLSEPSHRRTRVKVHSSVFRHYKSAR